MKKMHDTRISHSTIKVKHLKKVKNIMIYLIIYLIIRNTENNL